LGRSLKNKEAAALDSQIVDTPGGLERALPEDAVHAAQGHTQTDLDRVDTTEIGLLCGAGVKHLAQQFVESRTATFISRRVNVGDIVGHHIHIDLVVANGRCSTEHGAKHG